MLDFYYIIHHRNVLVMMGRALIMKFKKKIAVVLLLTMIYTLFCGYEIKFDREKNRVIDEVGYLTATEVNELQRFLTAKSTSIQLDLAVCICNEPVSGDPEDQKRAEEIYETNGLGYDKGNSGVLLYINLNSRYVYICTTGIAIWYIDDYDIEDILDDMWEDIEYGDYFEATKTFATDVAIISTKFINNSEEGIQVWKDNDYEEYADFYFDWVENNKDVDYSLKESVGEKIVKVFKNPIGCAIIGAIISGIIVLVMCMRQKTKMKANKNTYMDTSKYAINQTVDQYLRTTTVKTKIEKSSGGGGGGGSFRGSHGGGGRHF